VTKEIPRRPVPTMFSRPNLVFAAQPLTEICPAPFALPIFNSTSSVFMSARKPSSDCPQL
jgi:hypothetical protein